MSPVLRLLFNGHVSTQIGGLLTLSKASVIDMKKSKWSSSLMAGSVENNI